MVARDGGYGRGALRVLAAVRAGGQRTRGAVLARRAAASARHARRGLPQGRRAL